MAVAIASMLVAAACTTANPVMTFFFDGVPNPGEVRVAQDVVRNPRRPTYKPPPPPVKFVEVPDLPPAIDWKGRYQELPRNDDGEVEWTKALDAKLITLKAAIGDEAKEAETEDAEVELATSGQAKYTVVFSHLVHTKWLACDACHNGIFKMKAGSTKKIKMDDFDEGKYCGACHGKVAAPDTSACADCHLPMRKKKA